METLLRNESFTTVAIVHCETSTGIINPVEDVARLVASLQPGTVWTPVDLPVSLLACVSVTNLILWTYTPSTANVILIDFRDIF